MSKFNPFQSDDRRGSGNEKDRPRDPLDVKELLTDNTRKAVITPQGELKLQKGAKSPGVGLMKERYWGTSKDGERHE